MDPHYIMNVCTALRAVYYYIKIYYISYTPNGIHELWERVQVEWERIPVEECQKLIESMPRRVQAVLKAKGGYTKY